MLPRSRLLAKLAGHKGIRSYAQTAAATAETQDSSTYGQPSDHAGPSNWYLGREASRYPYRVSGQPRADPGIQGQDAHNVESEDRPSQSLSQQRPGSPISLNALPRVPSSDEPYLHALKAAMYIPHPRREGDAAYSDRMWNAFHRLSPSTKQQLPGWFLKRILRQVVPPENVIRTHTHQRQARARLEEQDISNVTSFPWEQRLQHVISYMRMAQDRLQATGQESTATPGSQGAQRVSSGDAVSTELRQESGALDRSDYLFVLRALSLTGHLVGSEQVIREMKAQNLPLTSKVYYHRLQTLTKWINIRKSIFQRFAQGRANAENSRTYGRGYRASKGGPPFFPPVVVDLLREMLQDMRAGDRLPYNQSILDLLLRTAKETGNQEAFDTVLQAGYLVNLKYPDAAQGDLALDLFGERVRRLDDIDWTPDHGGVEKIGRGSDTGRSETVAEHRTPVNIGVHALNTIVSRYADVGDIWKMVQAFEVLGSPLREGHGKRSLLPEDLAVMTSATEGSGTRISATSPSHNEALQVEPPLTLTEALQREAESGDRLSFFGRPIPPASAAGPTYPFPIQSHAMFLPPLPNPLQIEQYMRRHGPGGDQIDHISLIRYSDEMANSNSSTFAIMVKACAVEGGVAVLPDARRKAVELGIHMLRCGVHDMQARHNAFLESWIRVTVLARDLAAHLSHKPEHRYISPTTGELAIRSARTGDRAAVESARVHELRSMLRSRMGFPKLLIGEETIKPLISVLRGMSNKRGEAGLGSWLRRRIDEVYDEVEKVKDYLRQEYEALTGRRYGVAVVRSPYIPRSLRKEKSDDLRDDLAVVRAETIGLAEAAKAEVNADPLPGPAASVVGPSAVKAASDSVAFSSSFFSSAFATRYNALYPFEPDEHRLIPVHRRLTHESAQSNKRLVLGTHLDLLKGAIEGLDRLQVEQEERLDKAKARRRQSRKAR